MESAWLPPARDRLAGFPHPRGDQLLSPSPPRALARRRSSNRAGLDWPQSEGRSSLRPRLARLEHATGTLRGEAGPVASKSRAQWIDPVWGRAAKGRYLEPERAAEAEQVPPH